MAEIEKPGRVIEGTLNDVLTRINLAEDIRKETERNLRTMKEREAELEREARGLRLALLALNGEPLDEDEADKQNAKTRAELRRART